MKEQMNSQHHLYTQALKDPTKLSEDDLLQLIVRYPYCQPLIFAYERRKKLFGEDVPDKSLALLYAPSANWLWSFINSEVRVRGPKIDVLEEQASIDEELKVNDKEVLLVLEEEVEPLIDSSEVVEISEEPSVLKEEKDELDLLLHQGSVLADYFIFDSKSEVEKEVPEIIKEEDPEDVSLYNDDLMPYSFRWWLHKTRMEHANTYQPFAVSNNLTEQRSNSINFGKLDEAILDQQIKESIIHFQDPEEKLSDQVKSRPVEPVLPKKTDSIIERFIREEPIIQAPSAENLNNENMARQSAEDNYMLVTETLANIYKDQGLFQKAIEVFGKLILKYPEKKSYFAHRIQELEKNL